MFRCSTAATIPPPRQLASRVCGAALMCLPAAWTGCLRAQAPAPVPAPASSSAPVQGTSAQKRPLSNEEIAQRPYNPIFTPPQYPSSQRQQKQFTVQYVYNYAESSYTPPVPLPVTARSAAKFDTPENALTSIYSAMRNGDYDAWLNCWDEVSRAQFDAATKASPRGKQVWLDRWKTTFTGKKIVLTHRLETVNYVILDTVLQDTNATAKAMDDSEVLVFEKGRWLLSNQFQGDGLITQHDLKATGDKVSYNFDLRPLLPTVAGTPANHAQEQLLKVHNKTSVVTETVE